MGGTGEGVGQSDRGGLSRRQMIKASAVAGAAAWTAPMIIDSLSSPAAAGTFRLPNGVGCLRVRVDPGNCTTTVAYDDGSCQPGGSTQFCQCNDNGGTSLSSLCMTVDGLCPTPTNVVVFATSCTNCTWYTVVGGNATMVGGGCIQAVLSADKKTLTFTKTSGQTWASFRVVLVCPPGSNCN